MLNLNNYPIIDRTHGSENVSSKYKAITTRNVIEHFMRKGFTPTKLDKARTLKSENEGYQKHIVTFDCPAEFPLKIDGLQPKLHVLNSHNAKHSLQIFLGVYRLVCSNGLVVGTDLFRQHVRHVGNVEENLSKALKESTNAFDLVAERINQWQNIKLAPEQEAEFARRAFLQRVKSKNNLLIFGSTIDSIVKIRRTEDASADLFTLFNRIQEALIQRPEQRNIRYMVERQVIDAPVSKPRIERQWASVRKLSAGRRLQENAKLWDLTENFYSEVA